MVLFDRHGVIRRYESAEDILEEFFELRMEFYSKRRQALIQVLAPLISAPSCCRWHEQPPLAAHMQYLWAQQPRESCAGAPQRPAKIYGHFISPSSVTVLFVAAALK